MRESVDHRRVRFGFRWFCPWWKILQGPTLRILLQLRCPEIIDVTGRVAARIPCANSRHFDEFACFLSILSRYVVSALAKEPCTYHIPFLHLFFSAAFWTRVVFTAFGVSELWRLSVWGGDKNSLLRILKLKQFRLEIWALKLRLWPQCLVLHSSWLLAVSSSPEATKWHQNFFHDVLGGKIQGQTPWWWFDEILQINPETNPASTFFGRCEYLHHNFVDIAN